MLAAMDRAVEASGATILNRTHHVFPPDGLTAVYLLSESHASIHTYPEFGACFVDLFTCGDHCSPVGFDQILREYLGPSEVNARLFLRHEGVEETTLHNY
jgi:S-adenosylmethionine decarboxylase proenzyme